MLLLLSLSVEFFQDKLMDFGHFILKSHLQPLHVSGLSFLLQNVTEQRSKKLKLARQAIFLSNFN